MNIMKDNNTALIIGVIVVVIIFFFLQQNQHQKSIPIIPGEESTHLLPPLPDYRHNPQIQDELHRLQAGFAAIYDLCLKGCGQQGGTLQQCTTECRGAFETACDKVESECSQHLAPVDNVCQSECQSKGYPADQCLEYCNNAVTYVCDELDSACQAGVTPV